MKELGDLTDEERARFDAWCVEQDARRDAFERECRIEVYSVAIPLAPSTVIVTHVASGAKAVCRDSPSQLSNKGIALERLGMKLGRINSHGVYLR